jgi:hypothetical protein
LWIVPIPLLNPTGNGVLTLSITGNYVPAPARTGTVTLWGSYHGRYQAIVTATIKEPSGPI